MEVISFKMLQILQFSIFLVRNVGIDAEMYSVQVPVMISTIGASEKKTGSQNQGNIWARN